MNEEIIWSIGSKGGRYGQLLDNYKEPITDEVLYDIEKNKEGSVQKWPLFHPSEADPDSGYRHHPYKIKFKLNKPVGNYKLSIHYLVIAPRLSFLEVKINGIKDMFILDRNHRSREKLCSIQVFILRFTLRELRK